MTPLIPIILLATAGLSGEQPVPLTDEPELTFDLRAPEGWTLSRRESWVGRRHQRHVYASFASGGDRDLRLDAQCFDKSGHPASPDTRGTTCHFGRDTWEAQVPPGIVYVDIGTRTAGPAYTGPYVWSEADAPERRIPAVLADASARWETEESAGYQIHFRKWGASWSVIVVARKPFDAADLESGLEAVRTIRFPESPVISPRHAIEVASPHLPLSMRHEESWMDSCGSLADNYDTVAEAIGTSYRVEFRRLDGTPERSVIRSVAFVVDRDGSVRPVD